MMTSTEIRQTFLDFFVAKLHQVVPSSPMVIKDDPTLMFTNAGMNQFKDIFLGNSPIKYKRVANSQKCLRVSGKHNDLEEVGHDTYHHTMFEMLGNWSFGDYFKKEAIEWAWEFLVDELKIDGSNLYATYFEGSPDEGLEADTEAYEHWLRILPEQRVLKGSKKDNFWEMGDTGPCGPCSEIHIDIRDDAEKSKVPGYKLVNAGHPQVIEIWNLVFIQFNRKSDGTLSPLPAKHVDTGMGFERLCMVLQGKKSNYDTDVFQTIIKRIGELCGIAYGTGQQTDVAMRVIADHLRAIAFSIADGQIPSNVKAGYVIRRILRRAVRYGYTFLNFKNPFINKLVPVLVQQMGGFFPELAAQQELITKVIYEEEATFLRTLETGIRLLDGIVEQAKKSKSGMISGKDAFTLYDTYGFPLDLTELILREHDLSVNRQEFDREMAAQKERSRSAATVETRDWVELLKTDETEFVGYDELEIPIKIARYRSVKAKGKEQYHLIFDRTPFYAEAGGQVGDTGEIANDGERIAIINTVKENNLIVHIAAKLPNDPSAVFTARVNLENRINTANNHTATHLLHNALREVLGSHVEQKGSLVHPDYLRFDFSHFQKMTDEEIKKVEMRVNAAIRQNFPVDEHRDIPMNQAKGMGAISLFGEKYGETVRVIRFGDSIELCGGTHTASTGNIGMFKIISEGAISAGIRRIEAVTAGKAEEYFMQQGEIIRTVKELLGNPQDVVQAARKLMTENQNLNKQIHELMQEKVKQVKHQLISGAQEFNGIAVITGMVSLGNADDVKNLAYQLRNETDRPVFIVLGADMGGKPLLTIMISNEIVEKHKFSAQDIIREAATEIQGGGGGQPYFATAGGKNPKGLQTAMDKAIEIFKTMASDK
ncbi:MAG TPA: alanine--tRNA ligase [Tenuifilaceae bacterium]|nr:alanine--tRNA ligase [Bacteroidales bacterium]HNS29962.1 alanine--tRNA ligase [Tenuifilaceae bacterium]HPX08305.1 alanine--tRNA ligase [Tenuifilaceae bacterium]HQC67261.1 alanine--tRNA ligase [Tenuifilaceae bacterium]